MPSLEQHHSSNVTKGLIIGDSGSGKTGALACLAENYRLWIMDFDNGVDIIVNLLRKKNPKLLSRVNAVTLTDTFRVNGARVIPTSATAWPRAVALLEKWETFGSPISTFGPEDIIIIDSINFAGRAAMRFIQGLNGRLAVPPQLQDYRDGQTLVEGMCQMLYADSVKCNVLGLTHIREISRQQDVVDDKGRVHTIEIPDTAKGFPETGTGRALSPTIGRYFNTVLLVDIVGSGEGTRRVIRTKPHLNVGLKNPSPGTVASSYPLETGLADYFKAVRS